MSLFLSTTKFGWGDNAPIIPDLGTGWRHIPDVLPPWEEPVISNWTERWVGPRAG